MAIEVLLPKLGFSMEEGVVSEWLVTDGGTVEAGQALFLLESDKSVQEIESPASGTLRIAVELNTTYPVGTVLAHIE
jgi:pyruvate/2-oxoglutarate dehydrogenase complex dihydrolipoamide acyltransferase (E2) component